jgi:small subunit ribosomal protein S20
LASKPRGWTGARTPSAIKRVRTAERREAINGPRRSAAKTFVAKALRLANAAEPEETGAALAIAMSALDRAAKTGAIHRNAAARRKSRLTRKVNATLGGEVVQTALRATKTTGKAAAAKAAKARVAASKAVKAKGAQTAAGKARAALSKTARVDTSSTPQPAAATTSAPTRTRATGTRASGEAGGTATKAAKAAPKAPAKTPKATKATAAPKAKTADKKATEKKSAKS